MNFENAFNCKQCPERNDEKGCPLWWEIVETNIHDPQQVRINKVCGLVHIPRILKYMIQSVERPAAEIEDVRNEIGKGFMGLIHAANNVVSEAVQRQQLLERSDGHS